ncbi:hypothetical protein [Neptuniibacter halophilus]|uniref:hypothetical protein n=1 Tax=Neptuniibacter halophilus TaxID=651666 RepID=UPI002574677C|nr:hypothetical protein [Neptuniibacter halophilus]
MTKIIMTKESDLLHITFGSSTTTISLTQGFSFRDGSLKIGEDEFSCTEKEYNRLCKLYHKTLKPKRSAHLIWASATVAGTFIVTFSLLILGLSNQPLQEPVSETTSIPEAIAPLQDPIALTLPEQTAPSSDGAEAPFFPFGNQ